jgi:23S rRNA pseudouridine1911/1915/1917 synthase
MSGNSPPGAIRDGEIGPITAAAEEVGTRLDRFLTDRSGLARNRVQALIESGNATEDGKPLLRPAAPVRAGAAYSLTVPPPVPARPVAQDIGLAILFEDRDLVVLNKPAGLVVHPAPGNEDGTLVNALLAHCGDTLEGIGAERRPGIVHRLDKETSGVMVVAKTELAMNKLAAAFAARDLKRSYLALAWGLPAPATGTIEAPIGRDKRDRKRMAVLGPTASGGRAAITHYRTLAAHALAVSLLECRLATGRTHQIRVHLAHRGHPLVGDPVYLRRIPATARGLAAPLRSVLLDFPRQALHAASLGFIHPRTGENLRFSTPPPADFQALLDALELSPS